MVRKAGMNVASNFLDQIPLLAWVLFSPYQTVQDAFLWMTWSDFSELERCSTSLLSCGARKWWEKAALQVYIGDCDDYWYY